MMLSALRDYDIRDYDHEVRAQYPNPIGTPQRHRIKRRRFKITPHRVNGAEGATTMAKSVEEKKKTEAKPAKKKEAPTSMGTKEVAQKLGVDPKFFRAVLRANGKGADGQRYTWPLNDPLKKERQLIADYQKKQAERKANAAAKAKEEKESVKKGKGKSKKEEKAPAKKGKGKKAEPEEEPEEEETEPEEEEAFEEQQRARRKASRRVMHSAHS